MQTDRQTQRQTDDRHTGRQTHYLLAYAGGNKQIMQFMQKFRKKSRKNQQQYLSLEAGIDHFDFLSLYCMNKETLQ